MANRCCQDCGRELKGMLGSFLDERICSKCKDFALLHTDPARGYFTGVAGYFAGLRYEVTVVCSDEKEKKRGNNLDWGDDEDEWNDQEDSWVDDDEEDEDEDEYWDDEEDDDEEDEGDEYWEDDDEDYRLDGDDEDEDDEDWEDDEDDWEVDDDPSDSML